MGLSGGCESSTSVIATVECTDGEFSFGGLVGVAGSGVTAPGMMLLWGRSRFYVLGSVFMVRTQVVFFNGIKWGRMPITFSLLLGRVYLYCLDKVSIVEEGFTDG